MKKVIIISICISTALSFLIVNKNIFTSKDQPDSYLNEMPVFYMDATYAYDISNPINAVSTSDYVFVAKIEKNLRTEYRNFVDVEVTQSETKKVADSYTIYSISIIKNIKGNLKKNNSIEIEQFGGLSLDKEYYTFLSEGTLLEEGKYYLLLGVAPFDGSKVQINIPEKIIKLDIPAATDDSTLYKYLNDSKIILEYENAYKNEKKEIDSVWGRYKKHFSKDDLEYSEE